MNTAPEITSTTPPVTVWGVRYTRPIAGLPAGFILWHNSETSARETLGTHHGDELVSITGHVRVHPADATATRREVRP